MQRTINVTEGGAENETEDNAENVTEDDAENGAEDDAENGTKYDAENETEDDAEDETEDTAENETVDGAENETEGDAVNESEGKGCGRSGDGMEGEHCADGFLRRAEDLPLVALAPAMSSVSASAKQTANGIIAPAHFRARMAASGYFVREEGMRTSRPSSDIVGNPHDANESLRSPFGLEAGQGVAAKLRSGNVAADGGAGVKHGQPGTGLMEATEVVVLFWRVGGIGHSAERICYTPIIH
jgi:hypothetical protein